MKSPVKPYVISSGVSLCYPAHIDSVDSKISFALDKSLLERKGPMPTCAVDDDDEGSTHVSVSPAAHRDDCVSPPPTNTRTDGTRRGTLYVTEKIKESIESVQPHENDFQEHGVLKASFDIIKYDPKNTFGRYILGPDFEPSKTLFFVLLLFYTLGSLVWLLALWNFIPRVYIYFAIVTLPAIIYCMLIMNVDLSSHVAHQQATIVHLIWVSVFFICGLMEYQGQDHYPGTVLGMVVTLMSFSLIPFFDTFPADLRIILNKIVLPSLIAMVALYQAAIYFNWSECDVVPLTFLGYHVRATASSQMMTAMNNVIILMTINIVTTWKRPTCLVMIKAPTEVVQLPQKDIDLLRGMNSIMKEISQKHQVDDIVQTLFRNFMTKFHGTKSS